jgi:hypothetical protein
MLKYATFDTPQGIGLALMLSNERTKSRFEEKYALAADTGYASPKGHKAFRSG